MLYTAAPRPNVVTWIKKDIFEGGGWIKKTNFGGFTHPWTFPGMLMLMIFGFPKIRIQPTVRTINLSFQYSPKQSCGPFVMT